MIRATKSYLKQTDGLADKEFVYRADSNGFIGNNTLQSINILVNKLLPLNPDILVYMENINDLVILMYQKSYWGGFRPQVVADQRNPIRDLAIGSMKSLIPHISFELNSYHGSRGGNFDDFAQARGYHVEADTARSMNISAVSRPPIPFP